jgi:S-DNA-T family DNA segregation ATPase FtsK/SpoIIIE
VEMNSLKIASNALADTAFEIVLRSFPETTEEEHPVFRIKNLFEPEITRFLEVWPERTRGTNLEGAQVVISHDSADLYPQEFIADPNCSITYYRNNNKRGLIYIETSPVSDEQGLRNIFTLRDVNFLDGTFDAQEDGFFVAEEIVRAAWRSVVGQNEMAPQAIVEKMRSVLESLKANNAPVPVRRFAEFCSQVALKRSDKSRAYDAEETDSIIGESLIKLGLFPDRAWAKQTSSARTARRLFLNLQHADLVGPNGIDLDGEVLAEEVAALTFKDDDGAPLPKDAQSSWRELCAAYCLTPNPLLRSKIPYGIFEQLFITDTKGMKLGERVASEIDEADPSRLSDWNDLSIGPGLDRRDQGEAVRFLEADPDDGEKLPLRDLLTKQTLKAVEKVASPAAQPISNPLLKLAEVAGHFARYLEGEDRRIVIKMSVGKHSKAANSTVGLLAFLYGPTLSSLSESSKIGSEGFEFEIDERLLSQVPPPAVKADDFETESEAGDEILAEETWDPVPLEFHVLAFDGSNDAEFEVLETEARFHWDPPALEMLALFWLLVAASDAPKNDHHLEVPSHQSLDEWVNHAVGRGISLGSLESKAFLKETEKHELTDQLADSYLVFRKKGAAEGLSKEVLLNTFDEWLILADRFKVELVPTGSFDGRVEMFLSYNMIATNGGNGRLMLPTHPLRLRWIARYLERSEELAERALSGSLDLNEENSELYLDWIGKLSPHQQPALVAGSNQETIFATAENGWAEHFAPLNKRSSSGSDLNLDESCTAEISRQISSYLLAHPNKVDGLSLLVVLPSGSSLPAQLIKQTRKGDWKNLPISVHVLAPGKNWPSIITEFEKLPVEDRMSDPDSLLPPLQLNLHDLDEDEPLNVILGNLSCDIGIIPQFLADDVQVLDQTTQNQHVEGTFDVLLNSPTVLEGGTRGEAINVSKLPVEPDPALQIWSTLVVRHRRKRPISEERPENTDHVRLVVDFKREAELFELMHQLNHWVITIERHISREQIENLDTRPEILTVKDKVGSSGLYTLVVSSNSGRSYIIQRLERKLKRILGDEDQANRQLSERIYDEARSMAPSLALQAMGISRITEEMLGLVIAKHVAEARVPAPQGDAGTIWISLDEYADWLGGQGGTRADLCRITFSFLEGALHVDILVVEGKLRQAYDAHGELQATRTLNLFRNIFSASNDDDAAKEKIDASLWRTKILDAVNTAGPSAKVFSGRVLAEAVGSSKMLSHEIREKFSAGDFKIGSLRGLFSICNYSRSAEIKFRTSDRDSDVEIVESFKNTLFELVTESEPKTLVSRSAASTIEQEKGDAKKADENQLVKDHLRSGLHKEPSEKTADDIALGDVDLPAKIPSGAALKTVKKRLSEAELGQRYQSILDSLSEFGVVVRKPDDPNAKFTEGPASVLYRVAPGPGVSPNMIYQKADSLKLALRLREEQQVRFSIHEGYINIDVPKSEADRYYISAQELWEGWTPPEHALGCPIGIDQSGEPVEINFSSSNSPHLLIGGTTGSGKSEALNTILYGLTKHYSEKELRLLLIDPKGTELDQFDNLPHLEGHIGMDDDDAREMLDRAVQQMQWRYERLKSEKTRSLSEFNQKVPPEQQIPWWVIVLDEYADLTSDPDSKKAIEASLKRLAQKARAAGIHVIIATQKPSAEVISTNLRSNLPAQLALRVKSGTESRVIMDEQGAETLNGKGDAFLKSEGKLIRVQCGRYEN